MFNGMTNLLPPERQRALARDYLLRLSVVIVWFLTALTAAAAVLLVPTYVFLTESADAKNVQLAHRASTRSSADEAVLSARLAALTSDAATLAALGGMPSTSGVISAALAIPRPGVTLSGFSYMPAAGTDPGIPSTTSDVALGALTISGHATTRNALREYQLALQSAPFARSAVLPVSAYAQDTNVAFTITVTLAP